MAALTNQIAIGGLETEEEEAAEIEAGRLWRDALYLAIKTFISGYIANGTKGYVACAAALNARWGSPEHGRQVTAALLGATLKDSERNYFRAEWLDWFACRCPEVAAIMARRVRPVKTAEDRFNDLEAEMREVVSHKTAEQVLRRARAR